VVRRRGHFSERQAVVLPTDNVPRVRNLHGRFVTVPLDLPRALHLEQLRVQRSAVQLKDQLSDFWTNG
jgi:hypothetical protein